MKPVRFGEILKNIKNKIYIGFTIAGTILIYAGIGGRGRNNISSTTNWYFILVGVVLLFPLFYDLMKHYLESKASSDNELKRIQKLKETGHKLKINLDHLEVKTNSLRKKVQKGTGYHKYYDYIDVNSNTVKFDIPYKDQIISYKTRINLDPNVLKMHFAIQKSTTFFVDLENTENNYLDLSFLKSS